MVEKESTMTKAQRDLMMGTLLLIFAIAFFVLTHHFSGYELEEIPGDVGVASIFSLASFWPHWPCKLFFSSFFLCGTI
jgi:hypothetical protein